MRRRGFVSICQRIKLEFQVLSVHKTFAGKSFDEVINFVNKLEGVRRDGKAKALAKIDKKRSEFLGSYSRGSNRLTGQPIQFSMPACTGNYSGTL